MNVLSQFGERHGDCALVPVLAAASSPVARMKTLGLLKPMDISPQGGSCQEADRHWHAALARFDEANLAPLKIAILRRRRVLARQAWP